MFLPLIVKKLGDRDRLTSIERGVRDKEDYVIKEKYIVIYTFKVH